ncbi:MAG: aspartate/glutamate racemase family protein [Candidatus Thorarchaeota archaeon]|nr:aspartate/glutamate racemase family protein [Candidatus Thorarchaeota archaeon]
MDWWKDEKKRSFVEMHTPDGYEIQNFVPAHGTHSVESLADEAYNAPFILEQVAKANREGYDALVIDCACDPVLEAAREISSVPVVGPRNAALHIALSLGTNFGIVTVQGQSLKRCIEHGVRKEGLESFCTGVRYLPLPVLDLAKNPKTAQRQLREACELLISETGANVIVLGCTGLSHEVDITLISEEIGVPIIDPFVVAIQLARLLVESKLSHSKIAYPTPPRKGITEAPSLKGAFDDILKE